MKNVKVILWGLGAMGGGIDRKLKLLTLEGVDMSRLFVPKKGTAL